VLYCSHQRVTEAGVASARIQRLAGLLTDCWTIADILRDLDLKFRILGFDVLLLQYFVTCNCFEATVISFLNHLRVSCLQKTLSQSVVLWFFGAVDNVILWLVCSFRNICGVLYVMIDIVHRYY